MRWDHQWRLQTSRWWKRIWLKCTCFPSKAKPCLMFRIKWPHGFETKYQWFISYQTELPLSHFAFRASCCWCYPFFYQGLANLSYFWQDFPGNICRTGILHGKKKKKRSGKTPTCWGINNTARLVAQAVDRPPPSLTGCVGGGGVVRRIGFSDWLGYSSPSLGHFAWSEP